MILREWRARATPAGAKAYQDHFEGTVLPALREIDGFVTALLAQREVNNGVRLNGVELVVLSMWDSLEAIKRFAGDHWEWAVVAPDAQDVLTSYDPLVTQYDIRAVDPAATLLSRDPN